MIVAVNHRLERFCSFRRRSIAQGFAVGGEIFLAVQNRVVDQVLGTVSQTGTAAIFFMQPGIFLSFFKNAR